MVEVQGSMGRELLQTVNKHSDKQVLVDYLTTDLLLQGNMQLSQVHSP